MNKSLTRSIGFWLLIVLSIASGVVGGWLVNSQLTTMTAKLLDQTATGVEVYVGQSLAVLGSVLVGAGILGILIALALVAVRSLIPTAPATAPEPIDWSAQQTQTDAQDAAPESTVSDDETPVEVAAEADAEAVPAGTADRR